MFSYKVQTPSHICGTDLDATCYRFKIYTTTLHRYVSFANDFYPYRYLVIYGTQTLVSHIPTIIKAALSYILPRLPVR